MVVTCTGVELRRENAGGIPTFGGKDVYAATFMSKNAPGHRILGVMGITIDDEKQYKVGQQYELQLTPVG